MSFPSSSLERRIYAAETRLLGALLRSPRGLARTARRLQPLDFYDYRHQLIWAAMLSLHQRGAPVSVETVLAELDRSCRDDDAGGQRYLSWLVHTDPAPRNSLDPGNSIRSQARS